MSEISKGKLDLGYWIASNRIALKWSFLVFLIIFNSALIGYNGYKWFDYLVFERVNENYELRSMLLISPDYMNIKAISAPQPLVVSYTKGIKEGESYDLLARIENNNPNYWVEFDCIFYFNEILLKGSRISVMPMDDQYCVYFNHHSERVGTEIKVSLQNISWRRLLGRNNPDLDDFKNKRMNISIDNINISSFKRSDSSFNESSTILTFDVLNSSQYNIKMLGFYTLLQTPGGDISAINYTEAKNLVMGEKKEVSSVWFKQYPQNLQPYIKPIFNYFNDKNYYLN